jgi:replicative DNA helicase
MLTATSWLISLSSAKRIRIELSNGVPWNGWLTAVRAERGEQLSLLDLMTTPRIVSSKSDGLTGFAMQAVNPISRNEEVTYLSRQMKLLARELEIPVIVISQLNRAVESRDDKRPQMADLRDSGSLEQDADVIIFLYREDYYKKHDMNHTNTNVANLIVAKHRNGDTTNLEMHWDGETMAFSPFAANDSH